MGADELVESSDPFDAFGKSSTAEAFGVLVHHVHVVMGLGPVTPTKIIWLLSSNGTFVEPEDPSSSLMDQCSRHDIPPAVNGDLTADRGTI
jgi:hypothetical protein